MVIKSKMFGTLVGTFGKGVEGSNTINFGPSGSEQCSDECPLKGRECYAEVTEKRKPSISVNLRKKAANPEAYAKELADNAHKLIHSPWIRFNAFGSIPMVASWDWFQNMKRVAAALPLDRVHFPVETLVKAATVKAMGFTPRVSAATDEGRMYNILNNGHVASLVVDCGKRCLSKNKRTIAQPAFEKAHELNARGIKTRVCPAITGSAKCGACKLCADAAVKVVIYPYTKHFHMWHGAIIDRNGRIRNQGMFSNPTLMFFSGVIMMIIFGLIALYRRL
ncbi:MAG: hypothetical protein HC888_01110 [Candidatus Competibacteraceae bacterium]|nr:hypothetical protein [Candidatus Competibacteraceae bacterium]